MVLAWVISQDSLMFFRIAELSQQISTVETSLSELPEMDNVRAEGLRSQRQVLQREVRRCTSFSAVSEQVGNDLHGEM